MSLQNKVVRLEERMNPLQVGTWKRVEEMTDAELDAIVRQSPYDFTRLSDDELKAICNCYTESGAPVPGRMTPEIEAALRRVSRRI
jgi:hypothetical protein